MSILCTHVFVYQPTPPTHTVDKDCKYDTSKYTEPDFTKDIDCDVELELEPGYFSG